MNLIQRIDQIIEERSLLKHPFYEMWSDGKLTQESLAGYSKEYFQLVKAVPEFMTPIIQQAPNSVITELTENQQEHAPTRPRNLIRETKNQWANIRG